MTATRTYYAAQHPRGFRNETDVHAFRSAVDRDDWVRENGSIVNHADRAAWACTAVEAKRLIGYGQPIQH